MVRQDIVMVRQDIRDKITIIRGCETYADVLEWRDMPGARITVHSCRVAASDMRDDLAGLIKRRNGGA